MTQNSFYLHRSWFLLLALLLYFQMELRAICPAVPGGASLMGFSIAEGPETRGEPWDPRAAGWGHGWLPKVFQEGTGRHRVHERDLWPDVTLGGECVGSSQRPGKCSGEKRSIRSSLKAKKSFLFKYNMEKKSDPPFLLGGRLYNAVKCLNYCLIILYT